jgi:2-amino-4-hydroxy-6-hydroxymethyldihydropteridine diphosphokinase
LNARRRVLERTVVLSLGSNLGPREEHLLSGVSDIAGIPAFGLTALSSLYETSPVGISTKNFFVNMACAGLWRLTAMDLLAACRDIERKHGRPVSTVTRDRTLDIDIVLLGDETIEEPGLIIPHPRMHERLFVLAPLMEVCPGAVDPSSGRSIAEIYRNLAGEGWVRRISGRVWNRKTT